MNERNWSTKTLAKQLVAYIKDHPDIKEGDAVVDLMAALRHSIVEEEVGVSLDPWAEDE